MNLTPNQRRALRHLWRGDLTTEEIAEEMGFTLEELSAAAASLELPARSEPEVYVPSREEILLAAAAIREKWTQSEREARLAGGRIGKLEDATGVDTNARRRPACHRSKRGPADGSSR